MSVMERYSREIGLWRSMESGSVVYDDLGPPIEMPNATNTGWEHTGVTLEPYVGTHRIEVDTVIDSKHVDLEALFVVNGATLTVTRSLLDVQFVDVVNAYLVAEDVKINGGNVPNPIVGYANMVLRRCDITGGQHSVMCGSNGLIEYCWLHDQFNDPDAIDGYHNNAYISNGGHDVTIRYNTMDCSTELTPWNDGGPSGVASIFGDFDPLSYFTFKGNLIKATTGSFGLRCGYDPGKPYGEDTTNIVVADNVWEKGVTGHNGVTGPVTSWNAAAPGMLWSNNKYDDGSVVNPA